VADLHRQLDDRLAEQARGAAVWIGEGRRHPDKLAGRLALIVKADVTIFDPKKRWAYDAAKSRSKKRHSDCTPRSRARSATFCEGSMPR